MDHISLNKNPFNILLVEDNSAEALLAKTAIDEVNMECVVTTLSDGQAAIDYLRHKKGYIDTKHPDLILLDLKMPGKSGKETLLEIKSDEDLKDIPVIIFSSSASEQDIDDCYHDHANSYVMKPITYDSLVAIMKALLNYWNRISLLPDNRH